MSGHGPSNKKVNEVGRILEEPHKIILEEII